ncbi:Hypothetical Protein FCC1311_114032, partial [Hondaea fermentalgiana]
MAYNTAFGNRSLGLVRADMVLLHTTARHNRSSTARLRSEPIDVYLQGSPAHRLRCNALVQEVFPDHPLPYPKAVLPVALDVGLELGLSLLPVLGSRAQAESTSESTRDLGFFQLPRVAAGFVQEQKQAHREKHGSNPSESEIITSFVKFLATKSARKVILEVVEATRQQRADASEAAHEGADATDEGSFAHSEAPSGLANVHVTLHDANDAEGHTGWVALASSFEDLLRPNRGQQSVPLPALPLTRSAPASWDPPAQPSKRPRGVPPLGRDALTGSLPLRNTRKGADERERAEQDLFRLLQSRYGFELDANANSEKSFTKMALMWNSIVNYPVLLGRDMSKFINKGLRYKNVSELRDYARFKRQHSQIPFDTRRDLKNASSELLMQDAVSVKAQAPEEPVISAAQQKQLQRLNCLLTSLNPDLRDVLLQDIFGRHRHLGSLDDIDLGATGLSPLRVLHKMPQVPIGTIASIAEASNQIAARAGQEWRTAEKLSPRLFCSSCKRRRLNKGHEGVPFGISGGCTLDQVIYTRHALCNFPRRYFEDFSVYTVKTDGELSAAQSRQVETFKQALAKIRNILGDATDLIITSFVKFLATKSARKVILEVVEVDNDSNAVQARRLNLNRLSYGELEKYRSSLPLRTTRKGADKRERAEQDLFRLLQARYGFEVDANTNSEKSFTKMALMWNSIVNYPVLLGSDMYRFINKGLRYKNVSELRDYARFKCQHSQIPFDKRRNPKNASSELLMKDAMSVEAQVPEEPVISAAQQKQLQRLNFLLANLNPDLRDVLLQDIFGRHRHLGSSDDIDSGATGLSPLLYTVKTDGELSAAQSRQVETFKQALAKICNIFGDATDLVFSLARAPSAAYSRSCIDDPEALRVSLLQDLVGAGPTQWVSNTIVDVFMKVLAAREHYKPDSIS